METLMSYKRFGKNAFMQDLAARTKGSIVVAPVDEAELRARHEAATARQLARAEEMLINGLTPGADRPIVLTYRVSQAAAGYGARIWINRWRMRTELYEWVSAQSKWGAPDKSEDQLIAWEFGPAEFDLVIDELTRSGWVKEDWK